MISVVIPTYNRATTIEKCLDSVLNQTYKDIEVIIVDDCSTDDTVSVVEQYSKKTDKIKLYVLEKNSGACVARNYGVSKSKGEYIAFQDSDDIWRSNKLESQYNTLVQNNSDVVFCAMQLNYSDGNHRGKKVPNNSYKKGFINFDLLLEKSVISTQTIFGKKECFERVQFDPNMPRLQDWDLMLRVVKEFKVFYLDEVLVDAYVQKNSISGNPNKGIIALNLILKKHESDFSRLKKAMANYWCFMAFFQIQLKQSPMDSYKKSLSTCFTPVNFAKSIVGTFKYKVGGK